MYKNTRFRVTVLIFPISRRVFSHIFTDSPRCFSRTIVFWLKICEEKKKNLFRKIKVKPTRNVAIQTNIQTRENECSWWKYPLATTWPRPRLSSKLQNEKLFLGHKHFAYFSSNYIPRQMMIAGCKDLHIFIVSLPSVEHVKNCLFYKHEMKTFQSIEWMSMKK
jgi:hypothetical protein